jgi:hypothetical protein
MINFDDVHFTEAEVRALNLRQPFASMMLNGKRYETRDWPTTYRGYVLLIASKMPYTLYDLSKICQMITINRMRTILNIDQFKELPLGVTLAIGRLVDCREMVKADESEAFIQMPDKYIAKYVHEYEDITPVQAVPWKGVQKWRRLTEQEKLLIKPI